MARKPAPTPTAVEDGVSTAALTRIANASGELAAGELIAMNQASLHRLVGRIEAAHFLETVSSRMVGEAYLSARTVIGEIGEMVVRAKDGRAVRVSSLEDFCDAVMPVSHRRCQQIAQAMHTLGPALYEQAEQLGLGHRNFSAIRALPNDMQDQVKAAIASQDRDEVLKLLEELAARNASLTAKTAENDKLIAAKDKVIAKKDAKLNELAEREEMRRNGTPDEREAAQLADLRDVGLEAEHALLRLVTIVDEAMRTPATEAAELAARQTIEYVAQRFTDALLAREIAVDLLGERIDPDWAKGLETASRKTRKAA